MPSTAIRSIHYHATAQELEIVFVTGRRYLYHAVPPEEAERFRAAFSKGRHFNAHLRGRYRFTELEPA